MADIDAAREILRDSFTRLIEHADDLTDGLTDHVAYYRPTPEANTITWLIWHTARMQDAQLCDIAGLEPVWLREGWVDRFGLDLPRDAHGYGHTPEEVAKVRASAELLGGYYHAVHRESRLHRFGGELAHHGQVFGGGGLAVDTALPHHVDPQRGMRKEGGDVDVAPSGVDGVEKLRERLPMPGQPVDHHHARDVLHAGHHVDEDVVIFGAAGCEADAAVAHHRGGDAVRGGRDQPIRPDRLAVVVGVQVDETGGDEKAGRVDLAHPGLADVSDGDHHAVADGDVGDEGFAPEAVDHGAAANDQVKGHPPNVR